MSKECGISTSHQSKDSALHNKTALKTIAKINDTRETFNQKLAMYLSCFLKI